MKTLLLCVLCVLCGCVSNPGFDESIPEWHGKRAYHVRVEVSDPGCHIEVNGQLATTLTNTVGEILVWAHTDGNIHDKYLLVVANPVKPGQHQQRKIFRDGDGVPHSLYFDLNLVPGSLPDLFGNKNVNINVNSNEK